MRDAKRIAVATRRFGRLMCVVLACCAAVACGGGAIKRNLEVEQRRYPMEQSKPYGINLVPANDTALGI